MFIVLRGKTFICTLTKYLVNHYSLVQVVGVGSGRPKKCMKLNQNFQRGWRDLEKFLSMGGGMDIFWNYIIWLIEDLCRAIVISTNTLSHASC